MYSAVSIFTLKPGGMEAAERMAPEQAALIKAQPGWQNLAFVKLSDTQFMLIQTWDTEQHLEDARAATMGRGTTQLGANAVREVFQGPVVAS
jgi:heme-degrading monooxygenase HmoA